MKRILDRSNSQNEIMKSIIVSMLLWFCTIGLQAQGTNGYWDNQRMTNKEIKLAAGEKIIVKSEDFPVGTTEFVYRITLLDENQKMVNDLASVLKAIPDPYYIGKGAGSAISLVSNISGNDKCTYAIFQNQTNAITFVGDEKFEKACVYQKNPVSKDAKVISLSKNICLEDDATNIWFVFKNTNWMMKAKIVLEIVPWVDAKASRGWNANTTKKLTEELTTLFPLDFLKENEIRKKFYVKLAEKMKEEYRFNDYQFLTSEEKMLFVEKHQENTFVEIGLPNGYGDAMTIKAKQLFQKGNPEAAITLMKDKVVSKPKATALQWNVLGEMYLNTKQFEKALQTFKTAEKIDVGELNVQMNLAHVYMFLDEFSKAKEIHKRYKDQNISATQSWKEKAILDLENFSNTALPQENITKVKKLLE